MDAEETPGLEDLAAILKAGGTVNVDGRGLAALLEMRAAEQLRGMRDPCVPFSRIAEAVGRSERNLRHRLLAHAEVYQLDADASRDSTKRVYSLLDGFKLLVGSELSAQGVAGEKAAIAAVQAASRLEELGQRSRYDYLEDGDQLLHVDAEKGCIVDPNDLGGATALLSIRHIGLWRHVLTQFGATLVVSDEGRDRETRRHFAIEARVSARVGG